MTDAFATVSEDEGVLVRSADVDGLTLAELRFPPGYVQEEVVPDLPYLALVLDGGLDKSFRRRTMHLNTACALTMPAAVAHAARFGPQGARIMIVKPTAASNHAAGSLDRLVQLRVPALTWLAWRLAGELCASDAAAPLAAAGFALELLAATSRKAGFERRARRTPAWLRSAEELLRARGGERVRLGELADAVGVHPTHLARAFRARYGVSVGEYGRRLRLEWAAAEIARGDAPLAMIATQAGFADQSHFTRLFRQHVGTTPAQYREETQPAGRREA
jgi:AraC family transcriptional regulator